MFIQLVPQNSILFYNILDKLVVKLFLVMASSVFDKAYYKNEWNERVGSMLQASYHWGWVSQAEREITLTKQLFLLALGTFSECVSSHNAAFEEDALST